MNFDWKHFVLSHLIWIIGGVIAVIGFRQYQAAHDSQVKAEAVAQAAQEQIASLRSQIDERNKVASQAKQVIVRQQAAVHTPEQAIAAMPDISDLPLHLTRVSATSQDYVLPAPDVIPLFNALADARKCSIDLAACSANFTDLEKVNQQTELQAASWKKAAKGTFWTRTWAVLKVAVPVAAVAYGVGRSQ